MSDNHSFTFRFKAPEATKPAYVSRFHEDLAALSIQEGQFAARANHHAENPSFAHGLKADRPTAPEFKKPAKKIFTSVIDATRQLVRQLKHAGDEEIEDRAAKKRNTGGEKQNDNSKDEQHADKAAKQKQKRRAFMRHERVRHLSSQYDEQVLRRSIIENGGKLPRPPTPYPSPLKSSFGLMLDGAAPDPEPLPIMPLGPPNRLHGRWPIDSGKFKHLWRKQVSEIIPAANTDMDLSMTDMAPHNALQPCKYCGRNDGTFLTLGACRLCATQMV